MRPLFRLTLAVCVAAGLLALIHSFPPEGTKATVIWQFIDERGNFCVNVELDGGGYATCKVSREVYLSLKFHDRVRVYPIDNDKATFVGIDSRTTDAAP